MTINNPRLRVSQRANSASPSIDNRCASAGAPRSVHDRGTVTRSADTASAHEHRLRAPTLDEQHLQALPAQRVERMGDDNETQILTGRCGTMA